MPCARKVSNHYLQYLMISQCELSVVIVFSHGPFAHTRFKHGQGQRWGFEDSAVVHSDTDTVIVLTKWTWQVQHEGTMPVDRCTDSCKKCFSGVTTYGRVWNKGAEKKSLEWRVSHELGLWSTGVDGCGLGFRIYMVLNPCRSIQ